MCIRDRCINVQINQVPFQDLTGQQSPEPAQVGIANRKYLDAMAQSGEWGDGIMLEAAARLYQRPILVVIHYEERCV